MQSIFFSYLRPSRLSPNLFIYLCAALSVIVKLFIIQQKSLYTLFALTKSVAAVLWSLCASKNLQPVWHRLAISDFEGLVVTRGGGINSSLLCKKENRSTELGLDYFCHYGFTAHCDTIIYRQEFSLLMKNSSRGLNKPPLTLKNNGLTIARISLHNKVNKQIAGKINLHTSVLRESDWLGICMLCA